MRAGYCRPSVRGSLSLEGARIVAVSLESPQETRGSLESALELFLASRIEVGWKMCVPRRYESRERKSTSGCCRWGRRRQSRGDAAKLCARVSLGKIRKRDLGRYERETPNPAFCMLAPTTPTRAQEDFRKTFFLLLFFGSWRGPRDGFAVSRVARALGSVLERRSCVALRWQGRRSPWRPLLLGLSLSSLRYVFQTPR